MHIPYHGEVLTGRVSYQPSSFPVSNLFCSREKKAKADGSGTRGNQGCDPSRTKAGLASVPVYHSEDEFPSSKHQIIIITTIIRQGSSPCLCICLSSQLCWRYLLHPGFAAECISQFFLQLLSPPPPGLVLMLFLTLRRAARNEQSHKTACNYGDSYL